MKKQAKIGSRGLKRNGGQGNAAHRVLGMGSRCGFGISAQKFLYIAFIF